MGNQWIDAKEAVSDNRLVIMSDWVHLTHADGATAVADATRKYICTIPAKSVVRAVWTLKTESFNAAGNDYLTVGTDSDDDLILNDLDISTAAATIPVVSNSTTLPYYTATDIDLYATYVYSSTAPSTGECNVAVEWMPWTQKEDDY